MKAVFLCVLVWSFLAGAWAQSVTGSGAVSGVVLEEGEAGLPDTRVAAEQKALGVRRTARTTLDGVFEITGLPPAAGYRLVLTRSGFSDWSSDEFEVLPGQRLNFEISMVRKEGDQAKKASPGMPLVNDDPETAPTVVNRQQIEALPTANRRWDSLVLLAPAVTVNRPLGTPAIRAGAWHNAYFVDGLLAGVTFEPVRSVPARHLAQDAVQGMEILSGTVPAEFGQTMGGAVNVITQSGGDAFHGGFYEYHGNQALNAVDRYALGENLFRRSHQAGFNLGGPVLRNKLYFFSNLEMHDAHGRALNRITNPVIVSSGGPAATVYNCSASVAQCSAAAGYLDSQINANHSRSEKRTSGIARLDYRRSDRNAFTLAGYAAHSDSPRGWGIGAVANNGGVLGYAVSKMDVQQARIEWISAPSHTSVNELRLGLLQDRLSNGASDSKLFAGRLAISVAGATIGEPYPDPKLVRERRFQLVDNLRVSFLSTTLLLGVDWAKTNDRVSGLANSGGLYVYPTLTAFAQDLNGTGLKSYTVFKQTFGKPLRKLASSEFALYLQDTWRVLPNLTVTGGLRWSKPGLPQPSEVNRTYYQTATLNSPNINADLRIGAAYRTRFGVVVRAGFGMYHAQHPGEMIDALFLGNGIYQSSIAISPSQSGSPLFPAILSESSVPKGTVDLMFATLKLRNPYSKLATLSLERKIAGGLSLSATYLGSRGEKLWTAEDVNVSPATEILSYTINDASGKKVDTYDALVWTARSDPDTGHVFRVDNGGSSWYRALVVRLQNRTWRGLSARASYTWSHSIDDSGGMVASGSVPWNTYNTDHRADQGASAFDQRHRLVVDWMWQPKVAKDASSPARYLLGGWEISSIATLASSQPATAIVIVNGQQSSSITMAYPGAMNGLGGWSRVPFLPVSSLKTGPEYTVNARLSRTIQVTERIAGRLLLEGFNVFNTQFNTGVNTTAYTATNGVLTPVPGVGNGNESRGYANGTNARSCQVAFRLTF